MITRPHFRQHAEALRRRPALPAAFVYPCDADTLQLALSCAFSETLAPVLVGPELGIRDAAGKAGLEIGQLQIADTGTEPYEAAAHAVALARTGRVAMLVKGSLGIEALLATVSASRIGPREGGRLSHAYFLDLPNYPRGLLLADAQLNVAPNIAAKKAIVLNTIELAVASGVAQPAVALLAATDSVHLALPSTTDAAALAALAAEGAFGSAIVDGPLTPDRALFEAAAKASGRESPVAGHADILIAPAMESAALLLRTLVGFAGGVAAGLVLGATVPIVVPTRGDAMEARMGSCVLAALLAHANRERAKAAEARAGAAAATEPASIA